MKPDMFRQPVNILVGQGFPTEIKGALDAYRHLSEWPPQFRDITHSVALKACKTPVCGQIEAETARGLYKAFAEKHDLIAPEVSLVATKRRGGCNPHAR
jgi:hypothetical protein